MKPYITEQDFIGEGRGIYTVDRVVRGSDKLLDNGTHEYYINLTGAVDNPVQRELLDYMKHTPPYYKTNQFQGIAKQVDLYKTQKEGVRKMCEILEQERMEGMAEGIVKGKAEGIAEGIAEGMAKGKAESVLMFLTLLGTIPEQLREKIEHEKDEEKLSKWLLSAAKSKSIEEFKEKTGL